LARGREKLIKILKSRREKEGKVLFLVLLLERKIKKEENYFPTSRIK
jgi:hypothetical protein